MSGNIVKNQGSGKGGANRPSDGTDQEAGRNLLTMQEESREPENSGDIFGMSKKKFLGLVGLVGGLVLAIIIIVVIVTTLPSQSDKEPKRFCKGDTFTAVKYNYSAAASGIREERFLKIKYVEDEAYENYYNFPQAAERCLSLNATLWEIKDGQVEWETLIATAKDVDKAMWINATPEGSCPNGVEDCLESEAGQGKGLGVVWPSPPNVNYSRLYKPATESNKCILVDPAKNLLWKSSNCKAITAAALCVKRDCEVE